MGIRLDQVGIVVKDMGRALDFYRVLGLDIPEVSSEEIHVEVAQSGLRLSFDKQDVVAKAFGGWVEPVGYRVELSFRCDSVQAVDELCGKIKEHGYDVHLEPWDAFWGQRYAVVQDPDGNHISLFAPL